MDWRLNDVSVSRHHGNLVWDSDVFLEDCNSKFGTLKRLNSGSKVDFSKKTILQCGRTVCQFGSEKSWSLFSCFGSNVHHIHSSSTEGSQDPLSLLTSYPSNGQHSLLVVNKKKYQRLLVRNEELKKVEEAKLLLEGEREMVRDASLDKIQSLKSMTLDVTEFLAAPKRYAKDAEEKGRRRKVRGVYIQFIHNIRAHRGDTADDVHDEDC